MSNIYIYIKLYFLLLSYHVKARASYRADFAISSVSLILINLTTVFSLWALFQVITTLEGFGLFELVLIYSFSLVSTSMSQFFLSNSWIITDKLKSGDFIVYYYKPINILFYFFSESFDFKSIFSIIIGIILFAYSFINLGLVFDLAIFAKAVYYLFFSFLISSSLVILASSVAFWTTNSFGILSLLERFRDFSRFPTTIFNGGVFVQLSYCLPISYISFYPVLSLTRANYDYVLLLSPLVAISLCILSLFFWNKGVKNYEGTGS